MKKSLILLSVLLSTNVWASSQLTCQVTEDVKAPLQVRSENYQVKASLNDSDLHARLDLASDALNLSFGVTTILSGGQQVIIVGITNKSNPSDHVSVDGKGSVEAFYDTDAGSLYINCSVQ